MICRRCKLPAIDGGDAFLLNSDENSLTWKRECKCGNTFTTLEKRVSYKHKGVRFDVCIGDDEPGARKS